MLNYFYPKQRDCLKNDEYEKGGYKFNEIMKLTKINSNLSYINVLLFETTYTKITRRVF